MVSIGEQRRIAKSSRNGINGKLNIKDPSFASRVAKHNCGPFEQDLSNFLAKKASNVWMFRFNQINGTLPS